MNETCAPSSRPVLVPDRPEGEDADVFANLGVHAEMRMALHMRAPDDDSVSILFGHERFRLEFFDVESLERLRNLADEGMRRLRGSGTTGARQADRERQA